MEGWVKGKKALMKGNGGCVIDVGGTVMVVRGGAAACSSPVCPPGEALCSSVRPRNSF